MSSTVSGSTSPPLYPPHLPIMRLMAFRLGLKLKPLLAHFTQENSVITEDDEDDDRASQLTRMSEFVQCQPSPRNLQYTKKLMSFGSASALLRDATPATPSVHTVTDGDGDDYTDDGGDDDDGSDDERPYSTAYFISLPPSAAAAALAVLERRGRHSRPHFLPARC